MGVFFERLKLGSTAAIDCRTGQNKGRYCEKELSFLLVSLKVGMRIGMENSVLLPSYVCTQVFLHFISIGNCL